MDANRFDDAVDSLIASPSRRGAAVNRKRIMLADISNGTDYGPPAIAKCVVLRMLASRLDGMLCEHGTVPADASGHTGRKPMS